MDLGYTRVSKQTQPLDRQIDALTVYGVEPRNIFQEKMTGQRRDRPEFNKMLDMLREGDTVIIAELTRVSRSTRDLLDIADLISAKGADLKSLKESWLDTTTAAGKLMFTIFAGLSQFERDLLSERTKDGLKAARARGRVGGRPSKQNEKAGAVEILYNNGVKIGEIAAQTELSRATVNRIIKKLKGVDER